MWAWPTLPTGFLSLYNLLPGYRRNILNTRVRVFTSLCLHRHRSLPHPARRRASANGRAGLRNRSSLRSCTGEGELGFWEALCATAQALHHGSPSVQVGRCCLPSSSTPSTSTRRPRRQQRCHQQRYCCDIICYTSTATSTRSVRATYLDLFSDGCFTVCAAATHVD